MNDWQIENANSHVRIFSESQNWHGSYRGVWADLIRLLCIVLREIGTACSMTEELGTSASELIIPETYVRNARKKPILGERWWHMH